MKLLILTQRVDKNDLALGFFHKWIQEFAKDSEFVTAIGLGVGEYDLPRNVKVLSLGKEKKVSKFRYVLNFYKFIWSERKNYDTVFVHMNQEYVLLGGVLWRFWGKKIGLWRNHAKGSFLTNISVWLSNKVFCTSPNSYTAKFKKTKIMPAGVDTDLFDDKAGTSRERSILFFGRFSRVKHVKEFVESLIDLDKRGVNFYADVVGSPANPEDFNYEVVVKNLGKDLVNKNKLSFIGGVKHADAANIYNKYSFYVNLTPSGSLDKTILEAMASSIPVLVLNRAFDEQIREKYRLDKLDHNVISKKIEFFLSLSNEERAKIGESNRKYSIDKHSLKSLIKMLIVELTTINYE